MTNPACPFCGFEQPEVTVFADDQVQAFIDLSSINRNHVVVAPRVHYERFADLSMETLMSVVRVVQRVGVAVRIVARPDAVSHLSDDDLTRTGFTETRARYGAELREALPG